GIDYSEYRPSSKDPSEKIRRAVGGFLAPQRTYRIHSCGGLVQLSATEFLDNNLFVDLGDIG
ncbi:unnamed protein product, partial [Adineta steineri]